MGQDGCSTSRAHLRRLLAVPLALAAVALIAACGGSSQSVAKATPAQLVSQTFDATSAVESGQVSLALTLSLDGVKQLAGKPITLDLTGPFQREGGAVTSNFAVTLAAGGQSAHLTLDTYQGHVYLGVGGPFYELPGASSRSADALGGPSGASGATSATGIFGTLGIEPGWLTDPHIVGEVTRDGVPTEHVSAQIDFAGIIADLDQRLSGASGASGALGSLQLGKLGPELQQAITSATIDLYSGVDDHILRELDVAIDFKVPSGLQGANTKITGGSLSLDLTQSQVNKPQSVTAPSDVQPPSKLLNGILDLESSFGSLASLAGGSGTLAG